MRVRSAFNINLRYEPAPNDVDKCIMLTNHKTIIEENPRNMEFGKNYVAWCEYPKIDKQEFERVKREYERTKMG